jgi:tetratricopeptide (TPR) repeat protein
MSEAVNAIELLERKVAANVDDAAARYQLAVLLLDEYGRVSEPELLSRAREQLTRAVQLRPKHAPSHAALGYTYDLTEDGAEQALVCFREARRLNPRDKE